MLPHLTEEETHQDEALTQLVEPAFGPMHSYSRAFVLSL